MSGAGVGETPNAAFAALSARGSSLGIAGLSSGITELEHFLKTGDDKAFTEGQDRRCRALNGLGLSKADKVTLAAVSMFQTGDDLDKWMESVFNIILLHLFFFIICHFLIISAFVFIKFPLSQLARVGGDSLSK